jgi:hypothetical protein
MDLDVVLELCASLTGRWHVLLITFCDADS